ncbi:hypothetical protein [Mucilaginibacter gilvus]|uniref:Uncharacterized protein n=1 Tax=Mucilaginibacter gilvus TaxID=2305909 RepID=A0A3S3UQU7_9SPHI|nr:hypothetical protein [Mucilaginibacter gilvus]RWY46069.1 hypothetical protein EPL05_23785 [Mucilaginibacter gilvus]
MIKTYCILLLSICIIGLSHAQIPDTYYGVALTRITTDGSTRDTSKLLYCRNISGSLLSVYTVSEGIVSMGTAYHISARKYGLYLYVAPIFSGQVKPDSLRIDFNDLEHTVLINTKDRYVLYPAYYALLKQEVSLKHSVMSLLGLLAYAMGDYPFEDALPLIRYTPHVSQQIQHARIVTQRSQADRNDSWECAYRYNKNNKLLSVSAADGKLIRFRKQVSYKGGRISYIRSYLNIEYRQITDWITSFTYNDCLLLKWYWCFNLLRLWRFECAL